MGKKKQSADTDRQLGFEDALAKLETIAHELEEGRLDLSDALARYEEGVNLLAGCHKILKKAERRIELLSGVDAEGNPIVQPFDEDEADASKAPNKKTSGRKARTSGNTPESPLDENDVDASGRLF